MAWWLSCLTWGSLGASVGGLSWIWLGSGIDHEHGFVAMIVGLLSALAVRWQAGRERTGLGPSVAAVIPTLVVICLAKGWFLQADTKRDFVQLLALAPPIEQSRQQAIAALAVELTGGSGVMHDGLEPQDSAPDELTEHLSESDFPARDWEAAEKRFEDFSPEEQERRIQRHRPHFCQPIFTEQIHRSLFQQKLANSLGLLDCVWLLASAIIAFKIAGDKEDESDLQS